MRPQCTHCQSTFSNLGNLTSHLKKKHGVSKNNTCECGRVFEKAQSLNAHYRHCLIHRNGRPPVSPGNKGIPSPRRGLTLDEFLGKEQAAITRARLSEANKGRSTPHTDETKRQLSLKRIEVLENSPHVKWFDVGGIRVQGSWEKFIAEKFVSAGRKIQRVRLPYDSHRHYTPDFYLPELDIYLEVKGWMSDRDKKKYQKVVMEHPEKIIKLLTGKKQVLNFNVENLMLLPDLKDHI